MTFAQSFAMRAIMLALFAFVSWIIYDAMGHPAPDYRPGAWEFMAIMFSITTGLAVAIVAVGIHEYRNGTFTR